jgi:hypothetical protein
MLVSFTHGDIEHLHTEETLRMYKPEAVLREVDDGSVIAALCYNLVEPPAAGKTPDCARTLRDIAERLELPRDYLNEIAMLAG